jgi:hypothetical protein
VLAGRYYYLAMADSGDEWLQELLTPAPPLKRPRVSDDDVEASQFLDELLHSHSTAVSWVVPALPSAALPKQLVMRPALPAALPQQLAGRPACSASKLAAQPACPANRIIVASNLNKPVSAASRKQVELVQNRDSGTKRVRMPEQAAVPKVKFNLAPSSNAGAILDHAIRLVDDIVNNRPTIFKIGITTDPAYRWGNTKYGYQHDIDKYEQMLVLSEADSTGAAMLEASLIRKFRDISGCRNTAPGGESVRQGCTIYTYIVFRHRF